MKKILGIGNALVDIIVRIADDRLLATYQLPKGGMEMVNEERKRALHAALAGMPQTPASGGSTSNTMHGIAQLGGSVGYIGKVGNDKMGAFFEEDMQKSGIAPHLVHTHELDTGIATTLMTPDAERTFATYLGAAATLSPTDIDCQIMAQYDYLQVEGYLIFNHDLILHICQTAKAAGLRISMDMASFNLVEEHHDFVEMLLRDYVDIIFANEEEARAFSGKDGEAALAVLSAYCPVAVVKLGAQGAVANVNGTLARVGTSGIKAIDTNGAGDAFAAGFLYGMLQDFAPEKCLKIASIVADEIVLTVGAKLSAAQWEKIRNEKLELC